jgi:predicted amidohydrolase YtcJ
MPQRSVWRGILAAWWVAGLAGCTPAQQVEPADLVFRNGAIYTVDRQQPWASTVAVDNGRIVYVGDEVGGAAYIGASAEVIDLAGRMLLPGLHDSHTHPMAAGTRFLRCQMSGLEWPDQVLAQLADCAARLDEGAWLRGVGLADAVFDGPGPHRTLLDEVSGGHPAFITTVDGYTGWLNTRALEIVGIVATTPDPLKGKIERDPVTGAPAGVLRGVAVGRVYDLLPLPGPAQLREALRLASTMANGFGITSVNEAMVRPELWAAYVEAERLGELTLRVQASQAWRFDQGLDQLDSIMRRRDQATGPRFRADAVKLFIDGGVLQGTASLLEPYAGAGDDIGTAMVAPEKLDAIVARLDSEKFQVHMHVYGDRAVRMGLDAIERAVATNGPRDRRHHLAHIALIHPDDLPRFTGLGVVADFQPLWAYLNAEREDEIGALGAERGRRLLAMNSMFASGARVVAGSDWISESMNPLYAIQIALTRRPPDGSGPAWVPEERVTLAQMLEAYTINGAWLARRERETGSIEVGKAADLVVLDRNLFEVEPMQLQNVKVLLTLLEGEVVYRDASFSP